MEIILLGIYAFFAWLIFFKFKWLPWNITTQVITVTLPIIGLTIFILTLNIVAPSSHDIRVVNYLIPINPPVRGLVTEVPIEPNRPIKKGDVLFQIDPTPYQIAVQGFEAQILQLQAQLVTARANSRNYAEQLKSAIGQTQAIQSQLALARMRLKQFKELAASGAGNKFDYEQAKAEVTRSHDHLWLGGMGGYPLRRHLVQTTEVGSR